MIEIHCLVCNQLHPGHDCAEKRRRLARLLIPDEEDGVTRAFLESCETLLQQERREARHPAGDE